MKGRFGTVLSFAFMTLVTLCAIVALVVLSPRFLPVQYQPFAKFDPNAPMTFVSRYQLSRAVAAKEACTSALAKAGVDFDVLEDFEQDYQGSPAACGIQKRIRLKNLGDIGLSPVETDCETALWLYLWAQNALEPLVHERFETGLQTISHFGSYSCRPMRTTRGGETRMSKHATARAFDVSGFTLTDGRQFRLTEDWAREEAFFTELRDRACDYFPIVLSPEYNALHADHFHFDLSFWRVCR